MLQKNVENIFCNFFYLIQILTSNSYLFAVLNILHVSLHFHSSLSSSSSSRLRRICIVTYCLGFSIGLLQKSKCFYLNSELASLDGREIAPVTESFDEQNFQEVITNMENSSCNISNHLSYFEKQRLSGDGSKNHIPPINRKLSYLISHKYNVCFNYFWCLIGTYDVHAQLFVCNFTMSCNYPVQFQNNYLYYLVIFK